MRLFTRDSGGNGPGQIRSRVLDKAQSDKKLPEILTVDELVNLLRRHSRKVSNNVLDGASGLRVGELLGLNWEELVSG